MKIKDRLKRIFSWRWWIIPIRIETEIYLEDYIAKLNLETETNINQIDLLQKRINVLDSKVRALQSEV